MLSCRSLLFFVITIVAIGCADDPEESGPAEEVTCEEGACIPRPQRPTGEQTCRLPGRAPGEMPALRSEALADMQFDRPVQWISTGEPGDALVVERSGRIRLVRDDAIAGEVLDISDTVNCCDTCCDTGGLLSAALAPDASAIYAFYTRGTSPVQAVVSRFSVTDGEADVATETELIVEPLPGADRPGGHIFFGTDGLLWIALGDGGDPETARDTHSLLGSILRIDPQAETPYGIPDGNPLEASEGRPEIWAWGFRNPWRCNPGSGDTIWCTDVGEKRHELNAVEKDESHGWPVMEGDRCVDDVVGCDPEQHRRPTYDYPATAEDCGAAAGFRVPTEVHEDLDGVYVFGDRCSGRIWGLRRTELSAIEVREIADLDNGVADMKLADDGSLRAVSEDAGVALELSPVPDDPAAQFPRTLSETGCFESLDPLRPTAGVIRYEVASPLWTDGAIKTRYLALPADSTAGVAPDGSLEFPEGSVLIKNFGFEFSEGDASTRRWVETRFMVRRDDRWDFFTYEWDGDDADILVGGEKRVFDVEKEDGSSQPIDYTFPDRATCRLCHGETASVLGPVTSQLDVDVAYVDGPENQLDLLRELDVVPAGSDADHLLVDPADESQPLELRAKSYLHANCSHCHRPGGWRPPELDIDLRIDTPLAEMGVCGEEILSTAFWTSGDYVIDPGNPENSNMLSRITQRGYGQMPPVATSVVDDVGVEVLRAWIESLEDCP